MDSRANIACSPVSTASAPEGADSRGRTVVLGIGNTLLADEGVGVHVVDAMRRESHGPSNVEFLDGGTLSYALAADLFGAARLIVVDAAELGEAPGALRILTGEAMDRFLAGRTHRSVHEAGLADLLQVLALENGLPAERALVAIQPQSVDWGDAPTPALAAVMPAACRAGRALIDGWPS
ncbi:MAG TPA: HyaD/HybD family hydrogenase maturation endopeptidase [Pelomicrobium sp.]|nr:HyaD/HybD family hydrogenase maturation endopeptidase [Pelomicrobium sp.]